MPQQRDLDLGNFDLDLKMFRGHWTFIGPSARPVPCTVTENRDLDLGDLDIDLEKFPRSRGRHWSKYHVCIMYGYGDT
jgi:hypothetical protein